MVAKSDVPHHCPVDRGKTFGVGTIYKILTSTTYMGEWKFNRMSSRTGKLRSLRRA